MTTKQIHCCGCDEKVEARLTDGKEIYPHRSDLYSLPFWKCDTCGNYVGCHHKTIHRTNPLGHIPTPELRNARRHIHAILDPIWKNGFIKRNKLYAMISKECGWNFHTSMIRSVEECRKIYKIVQHIKRDRTR